MSNSIINPKFNGKLILISGLYGLGKTTLAMTFENPALTAMIDFDIKGRANAEALGIWYRSPEASEADFDVKVLAPWFIKTVKEIPEGKTHLIIDNATWVEDGLGHIIRQNPEKYGVNPSHAKTGSYGGVNPGVTKLWASIFTYLQNKGVKTVTAINHMSQPWMDGKPIVNKFNIKGNKIFQQVSSLVIILVAANPKRGGRMDKTPSGLIVKEALGNIAFDETTGQFNTKSVLPPRVPVCTWQNINGYFDNPTDGSKPGETWDTKEREAYSEWLSPEQVQWVLNVGSYTEEETTPEPKQPEQKPKDTTPSPAPVSTNDLPQNKAQFWAAVTKQVGSKAYANMTALFTAIGGEPDWTMVDNVKAALNRAIDTAQQPQQRDEIPF